MFCGTYYANIFTLNNLRVGYSAKSKPSPLRMHLDISHWIERKVSNRWTQSLLLEFVARCPDVETEMNSTRAAPNYTSIKTPKSHLIIDQLRAYIGQRNDANHRQQCSAKTLTCIQICIELCLGLQLSRAILHLKVCMEPKVISSVESITQISHHRIDLGRIHRAAMPISCHDRNRG